MGLAVVLYLALGGLIIARWGVQYGAPVWGPVLALTGWYYTYRASLQPGSRSMPRRIVVSSDGMWWLDGRQGFVRSAWVTPWVCRVVISDVDDGRHHLWLARDALGEVGHWQLRRRLVQMTR